VFIHRLLFLHLTGSQQALGWYARYYLNQEDFAHSLQCRAPKFGITTPRDPTIPLISKWLYVNRHSVRTVCSNIFLRSPWHGRPTQLRRSSSPAIVRMPYTGCMSRPNTPAVYLYTVTNFGDLFSLLVVQPGLVLTVLPCILGADCSL
jgi:hypothetical protein